jgi:hypothetical protein
VTTSARAGVVDNGDILGSALNYPSFTGLTNHQVYVAWPQVEISGTVGQANAFSPGPFVPTLSAVCYGAPRVFANGALEDPANYSIGTHGAINFSSTPGAGLALTWSGAFAWRCRFDDDDLGIEGFMYQLFSLKTLKFSTELF